MPKKRTWKELNMIKKQRRGEEALDYRNSERYPDPTAKLAVDRIISKQHKAK